MRFIGITGAIGSGKTTLGAILQKQGFLVFDMDDWCRDLYKNDQFLSVIEQNFPYCFKNGVFDKKALRSSVFKNKESLMKLEGITHPYLVLKLKETVEKYRFLQGFCFVQSALLYQMGLEKYFDFVLMLKAPRDVLQKRVMKRDRITKDEFDDIIEKQQSLALFEHKADFVIDTNQNKTVLKNVVMDLIGGIEKC
ncbi:MAG: dephospho-CoA kinase [Alphaproteobacteria bacterium]|nr:dephospho-CoA kinase [Alphaproteobacteria bacterium]